MIKAKLLDSVCVVDATGRASNLASNMARGLPVCSRLPEREGALAIVGSGPSVRHSLEELAQWPGEIWAINGAYRYLLENGIVADGFVGVDPLPGLAEYVDDAQPETTFYIASTCDPSVLDNLKNNKVVLWHACCDDPKFYPDGSILIIGGTTVITRAPFLAALLGWRDITLIGVDSSYAEDSPYCYRWGTFKEDIREPIMKVMINNEGPFYTEVGLLKQVSQLGCMLNMFNKKIEMLKIRPAGLMGAFIRSPMLDDSMIEVESDAA